MAGFNRVYDLSLANNLPLSAIIELTYRCNLRCRHCYVADEDRSVLRTEDVLDALDQLAQLNTLFVTFTGGEVFLHPDFLDIARYAKKKKFAVKIFTNGTRIDEATADRIQQIAPLDVGMSLYSHRAAVHDGFTGLPGSFQETVSAVELLVARGIKVDLRCSVIKTNKDDLDEISAFARELGCQIRFDPIITPKNQGGRGPLDHAIGPADLQAFYERMAAGGERPDEPEKPLDSSAFCRAGRDVLSISPLGDVFPCVGLPMKLGNLRSQKIIDIWRSPLVNAFREQAIIANSDTCRTCGLLSYCNHCPGIDYVENGSITRPSRINCDGALAQASALQGRKEVEECVSRT